MRNPPPETLATSRLALRKPVPEDASAIFERWAQDPDITRYLIWRPHTSMVESERHVARCLDGWSRGTSFVWMMEDPADGRLVGSIAARAGSHGVELGYLVARDSQGHGYMTEVARAVSDWFLEEGEVFRVWATCDVDNHASARVLEKAGFTFEGVLRRWLHHPNVDPVGRRDARCYSRIGDGERGG